MKAWQHFWTIHFPLYISYLVNRLSGRIKKRFRIVFHPDYPHHRTVMYKVCKRLGARLFSTLVRKSDLIVVWKDETLDAPFSNPKLITAVNGACFDIRKTTVARRFEEVFGYAYHVNPRTFSGECVEKSDDNAKHDGHLVSCPREPQSGMVYQRLIDNRIDDDTVCDIRVPITGAEIPLIYFKFKHLRDRFSNDTCRVEQWPPDKALGDEEINRILSFANRIGLDYGELDVLRHRKDGRIYIVDVNKTPWGPPQGLPQPAHKKALDLLEKSFRRAFLGQA